MLRSKLSRWMNSRIAMADAVLNLGLLIEAEELAPYLGHEKLRIIDLCRRSVYEQLHIPQAVHVKPSLLVRQEEQATGLLPDQAGYFVLPELAPLFRLCPVLQPVPSFRQGS